MILALPLHQSVMLGEQFVGAAQKVAIVLEVDLRARRHAFFPPFRVFCGHDAFDGAEPIVETARRLVQIVKQLLVRLGQRRLAFPFGDVVEHHPRKCDEDCTNEEELFHVVISLFPLSAG